MALPGGTLALVLARVPGSIGSQNKLKLPFAHGPYRSFKRLDKDILCDPGSEREVLAVRPASAMLAGGTNLGVHCGGNGWHRF